jgi:hypothetical protein
VAIKVAKWHGNGVIQRKKGGQKQNIRQNFEPRSNIWRSYKTRYGEHDCIIGTMTWEPLPLLMCHQLRGHWIPNGTLICLLSGWQDWASCAELDTSIMRMLV